MPEATFTVRPTREDDWPRVRALRLEALADTPLAFGETLADALLSNETDWRARAQPNDSSVRVVAVDDETGAFVGTMGGFVDDDAELGRIPVLVGVYVTPGWRGRGFGVAYALLEAVETWAATVGPAIILHVHERNPRASALYLRSGYVPTGRTFPYELEGGGIEIELRKTFAPPGTGARLVG